MRKKILAAVVCLSMVIGVCGCGNTSETANDARAAEEIKETESEVEKETEAAEEETKEAEEETEPIYTVTASDLASIAQDFFMIQAKQYFNSGNDNLSKYYPTTINNMKNGYNLNIVSDWDENNFGGLKQSLNIIKGGLATKAGYTTNYSISVSSVANNFNNSYKYYVNSDAELVIAAKISVSSSIEHIENKNASNEGYVSVHYKLRSGSTDDWEIYGVGQYISSSNKTITAEWIKEEVDWDSIMVYDEDLVREEQSRAQQEQQEQQNYIDSLWSLLDDSAPDWKYTYFNYILNELHEDYNDVSFTFNLYDWGEEVPLLCYSWYDEMNEEVNYAIAAVCETGEVIGIWDAYGTSEDISYLGKGYVLQYCEEEDDIVRYYVYKVDLSSTDNNIFYDNDLIYFYEDTTYRVWNSETHEDEYYTGDLYRRAYEDSVYYSIQEYVDSENAYGNDCEYITEKEVKDLIKNYMEDVVCVDSIDFEKYSESDIFQAIADYQ